MKKVKAIKNLFGESLSLEKMEIHFIGKNFVIANYKGFGFSKAYGPWDGYTVEFEEAG